jgi:hypothetical protein
MRDESDPDASLFILPPSPFILSLRSADRVRPRTSFMVK